MKQLLNMQQASERLGIKLHTLRALVFRKEIERVKVGRLNRFDPDALEAWIKTQTKK